MFILKFKSSIVLLLRSIIGPEVEETEHMLLISKRTPWTC